MLPREDNEPAPALRPPTDTRRLEYRFSLAYVRALPEAQRPVEREVFGESCSMVISVLTSGPFSVQQLNTWKSTGFFGPQCENVEVRLVGGEWGQWTDVVG